jgi:hypothetical protein
VSLAPRIWNAAASELLDLLAHLQCADTPMLTAATAYAQVGIPVFPCSHATKQPFTRDGFKAATINPEQIAGWWKRWPRAMIGSASAVLVIDVDAGDETEVHAQLERLRMAIGDSLPSCPIVWTPRGGAHLSFTWKASTRIGNRANILGAPRGEKGIDVRGDGGYGILPPSRRSGDKAARDGCDGKSYVWDQDSHFADISLPAPPPALIDLLLRKNSPDPDSTAASSVSEKNPAMETIALPDMPSPHLRESCAMSSSPVRACGTIP